MQRLVELRFCVGGVAQVSSAVNAVPHHWICVLALRVRAYRGMRLDRSLLQMSQQALLRLGLGLLLDLIEPTALAGLPCDP